MLWNYSYNKLNNNKFDPVTSSNHAGVFCCSAAALMNGQFQKPPVIPL